MTDVHMNKFLVGMQGDELVLLNPVSRLSKADALNLAAYLALMADPGLEEFEKVLKGVREV